MSNVELSIQLQTDSIAAVKAAMVTAVSTRPDYTLWWLADYSHDITYQDRINGSTLAQIDQKVSNVDIGSAVFGPWFSMQNSYFSTDQPIPGVSTFKQAVETFYRWRVASYFNDIMQGGSSQTIIPQYVFPNADYILGTYTLTGAGAGNFVGGTNPLDPTKIGPGILCVRPIVPHIATEVDLTLTAVYQSIVQPPVPPAPPGSPPSPPVPQPLPATLQVKVLANSDETDSFLVGEQSINAYTASTGAGVVTVVNEAVFKVGQWVLIREHKTVPPPDLSYFVTEVAEVQSIDSANHKLTLGPPRLAGATALTTPGLRNDYSASAFIYPLFVNVTAATVTTGGEGGDAVTIGFDPDRPQGFQDISTISYPQ
jgi:hypothetical protein